MQLPKIPLQLIFFIFIIGAGYSVEALTCYVCSSDKLASCATLQNEKKDLPPELCPADTKFCFTKIENDVTIRGCSPIETKEPIKEDHHVTCDKDKCNNDIFPEDRLYCLHCAGSSCVNQASTVDVNYPCVNYDSNDKCYSIFSPDGKFAHRGCRSEPDKSFGKEYCNQHVQQCVECSDIGCNNKALEWSQEKLSCIKCKSADGKKCDEIDENVAAEECAPVVKGYENECYTLIGKDGIERGCLYEATVDVQKKCTDKESCNLCKDSGCNRAKSKMCYSGELEPFNQRACVYSKDSCFTYIKGDKVVKGCKMDYLAENYLEENFFDTLPKNIYEKCSPSLCNSKKIEPMECLVCDSETDPKCAAGNDLETKKCELGMEPTNCYHFIDNVFELTKRGCMSDLKNDENMLKECQKNGDNCKQCNFGLCNMRSAFLTCISCKYPEDPNCNANPSKSQICKLYNDKCFTIIENKNVIRGCLGETEHQKKCLDGDEMCEVCDPTTDVNCNKKPLDLEHCIECDSKKDGVECRSQPKKFEGRICNLPKKPNHEGCFVSIVGDHFKRGCISKLPQNEKDKCLEQSSTCKSFYGSNSNDVTSFQECYKCNSRDDPSCLNKLTPHTPTELCEITTSTCTTGIDKYGITHRRCSKDQSVEEKILKYHETCEGAKCNNQIFPKNRQQCYQCDGDSDCDLSDGKNKKENVPCSVYSELDQCYTYQDKDNKIYRGCLTDPTNSRLLCELNPSKCIKCNEFGCNNQPKKDLEFFPKDRLQCYRCSGDSDCDFTDGNIKKEKVHCKVSSKHDQCFSYMDNDKKMHRGCLSDASDSQLLCVSDPSKCVKCKVSGCNNQPKFRKSSLSCIHCVDDKDCGYKQNETKSKACSTEIIPYYIKEACYADKKTFKRGCTTVNIVTEISNPDSICFESNCNTNRIKVEQCQKCSSKLDGDCSVVNGKNISAKCDGDYPYDKRGCFTFVMGYNVDRGCVTDLKDRYEECLNHQSTIYRDNCAICETDDCNNKDRKDGGGSFGHRVTSTILLNIFAIFVIFLYY